MSFQHNNRNIGIFAHVDAGKTTTTEQMLFLSGRIKSLGDVNSGTAQTDWLEVERQRGISVRSAVTKFEWKGTTVQLIDTPGHIDFISEVERTLRVMDGAILIVSAVEGVQAQTELVWQALRSLKIPTLLFVNKMDRTGANPEKVVADIHKTLSNKAHPIQMPEGLEETFNSLIDVIEAEAVSGFKKELAEAIAEQDDALLMEYLETGKLSKKDIQESLKKMVSESEAFPILFGASKLGIGIPELLDAAIRFLPSPTGDPDAPVSGVVFKLERDAAMGRMAYVRLYDGTIRNRDLVTNHTRRIQEKVTQIRWVEGPKTEDLGVLTAGGIGVVYGWNEVKIGDIIGAPEKVPGSAQLATPLIIVQVLWDEAATDYPAVVEAFQQLTDEDPGLDLQWLKDHRELHLKVMGEIQLETLIQMVESRFGLTVSFGEPSVIYKETPKKAGEGFIAYTMPKPCWAILRFKIEPGPRGSGLQYSANVRTENLLERYQNEVAMRVPEALEQGLKGWEVTDLIVTLVEGEHHVFHTHPLDFAVATPMGIMDGLQNTGTQLLEPILNVRISVPEEFGGKLMNEFVQMRGTFETPVIGGGRMEIEGELPVATSLDFPKRLASMTKGRATIATTFNGYRESPPDVEAERKRVGVNPLDHSKFILAARKALS